MDTSEKYIKMCNCPEIKGRHGKWFQEDFYGWKNKERLFPVWLPRQDQIQEMIKGNMSNFYWLELFYEFMKDLVDKNPLDYADVSLEQLWLAFYMYEKHEKIWNGKEWEKKA